VVFGVLSAPFHAVFFANAAASSCELIGAFFEELCL